MLDYVGRYTHRVAISNNRLLDIEDDQVQFNWKDYRGSDQLKTMTLNGGEFIRRFLLHVLPNGFQRIRYYGFLGNRHREEKFACAATCSACRRAKGNQTEPVTETDYRDRYEDLTGRSLRQCPHLPAGPHGRCPDPPAVVRLISSIRGLLMIIAARFRTRWPNLCRSFGTTGEVHTIHGLPSQVP